MLAVRHAAGIRVCRVPGHPVGQAHELACIRQSFMTVAWCGQVGGRAKGLRTRKHGQVVSRAVCAPSTGNKEHAKETQRLDVLTNEILPLAAARCLMKRAEVCVDSGRVRSRPPVQYRSTVGTECSSTFSKPRSTSMSEGSSVE